MQQALADRRAGMQPCAEILYNAMTIWELENAKPRWWSVHEVVKRVGGRVRVVMRAIAPRAPAELPWIVRMSMEMRARELLAAHELALARSMTIIERGDRIEVSYQEMPAEAPAPAMQKRITWFDGPMVIACDGRCDKAWGIQARPRTMLSTDIDDYVYKSDAELGTAPGPGETEILSEGSHMKPSATPLTDPKQMNKWCTRQCERCSMHEPGEPIVLRDLARPEPNISRK